MAHGRLVLLLALVATAAGSEVAVCPGEGPRYGDFKCNHDDTHHVCAQLIKDGKPIIFKDGKDFWQITGQSEWSVGSDPKNGGDDWCICIFYFVK